MEGLTGLIKFDTQGYRTFFYLTPPELTPEGLSSVSSWNPKDGANVTRPTTTEATTLLDENLVNKTLIVSSKLVGCIVFEQLNRLSNPPDLCHPSERSLFHVERIFGDVDGQRAI